MAGGLPGKPLSLAVAAGAANLVLVGTDGSGLYLSSDRGTSWRPAGGPLSLEGAGAVAVSALSVNPADDQAFYAISTYTMATPEGVHSIQATYVSVDDARHWFTMAVETPVPVNTAISSPGPNVQLYPVGGQLLAVSAAGPSSMQTFELVLGPELLNGLEAPDAGLRAAAATAMGLTGDADAVAPLLRHLKDPDQAAGDRTAEALGHLGDSAALPALRAALSDSNEAVRGRAAYALGLLQDTASIPALFNMLRSDGPLARSSAASGLAALGTPEAIWVLVQQLSASGPTPQSQVAMQALEEVGQSAAPQVIGALSSPDAMARRNAAELLGYMAPPQAVPALAQALGDPDAEVRAQAALALGGIGTVPAQQALAHTTAVTQDEQHATGSHPGVGAGPTDEQPTRADACDAGIGGDARPVANACGPLDLPAPAGPVRGHAFGLQRPTQGDRLPLIALLAGRGAGGRAGRRGAGLIVHGLAPLLLVDKMFGKPWWREGSKPFTLSRPGA